MAIDVRSEVRPLKKVLLQRPGRELEQLVPNSMERLLFDDIPYLRGAQTEHDRFAQVLRDSGVEVVYLTDLAAETLALSDSLRRRFVEDFIRSSGCVAASYREALTELLLACPNTRELIRKTMTGVRFDELPLHQNHSLASLRNDRTHFVLEPIPNLYFTRDPFASIGRGVALHHMYSVTRNRETIYGNYILHYHPDYAGKVPFYYTPDEPYTLEGGDILNLSADTIAVGISQRTMPEAVERLAYNIFQDEAGEVRRVLALDIPSTRAFMHLDTVLTQIDTDKFLIHPSILDELEMFELTPGKLPASWESYKDPDTGLVPLGDMAISLERAKQQRRSASRCCAAAAVTRSRPSASSGTTARTRCASAPAASWPMTATMSPTACSRSTASRCCASRAESCPAAAAARAA